jgi:hypothetical protein
LKRYSERAILERAREPRAAEKESGHDTGQRRANHAYRRWSVAAAGGAVSQADGFEHVANVKGGTAAWQANGQPLAVGDTSLGKPPIAESDWGHAAGAPAMSGAL